MIKYMCKKCNIEYEISECPVCKEKEIIHSKENKINPNEENYRNEYIKSTIYWCNHCQVPIYDKVCSVCGNIGNEISSDIRPVFPEERLLLEATVALEINEDKKIWSANGSRYIINGEKLKIEDREATLDDIIIKNPQEVKEKLQQLKKEKLKRAYEQFNKEIETFVKCNKERLSHIESKAFEFIREVTSDFELDEMFVSFSGGKDSSAVSSIVMRALGKPDIFHIYGDTTMEFRETEEYKERFRADNIYTPVKTVKNGGESFESMCRKVGPPARLLRWCCTSFKTGPINEKMEILFNGKDKILSFHGIRWCESASRSRYKKISEDSKIAKQKVACPIIDWMDFDVWLYLLGCNVDFNDAYRYGFTRVGCWLCPNNSDWSVFLTKIYVQNNDKEKTSSRKEVFNYNYNNWRDFLLEFARSTNKENPESYVDEGLWKARQGGNGIEASENIYMDYEPCVNQDNIFNYQLKRPICKQLYEFFKPFGYIAHEYGNKRLNETYVVSANNIPLLKLSGREGQNKLKIEVLKFPMAKCKSYLAIKQKIECQLTKYQIAMCMQCKACKSVCKRDAITIKSNEVHSSNINENVGTSFTYEIDDKKCIRCGDCINHFNAGCYMRKILMTRRGE